MHRKVPVRFGPGAAGKGPAPRAPRRRPTGVDLGGAGRTGGRRAGHPGRQGLSGQHVREDPVQRKEQAESQKEANRAHAKLRAPGERANAQLKTWRILRKLRCCPNAV
jgi:hypothetical protein